MIASSAPKESQTSESEAVVMFQVDLRSRDPPARQFHYFINGIQQPNYTDCLAEAVFFVITLNISHVTFISLKEVDTPELQEVASTPCAHGGPFSTYLENDTYVKTGLELASNSPSTTLEDSSNERDLLEIQTLTENILHQHPRKRGRPPKKQPPHGGGDLIRLLLTLAHTPLHDYYFQILPETIHPICTFLSSLNPESTLNFVSTLLSIVTSPDPLHFLVFVRINTVEFTFLLLRLLNDADPFTQLEYTLLRLLVELPLSLDHCSLFRKEIKYRYYNYKAELLKTGTDSALIFFAYSLALYWRCMTAREINEEKRKSLLLLTTRIVFLLRRKHRHPKKRLRRVCIEQNQRKHFIPTLDSYSSDDDSLSPSSPTTSPHTSSYSSFQSSESSFHDSNRSLSALPRSSSSTTTRSSSYSPSTPPSPSQSSRSIQAHTLDPPPFSSLKFTTDSEFPHPCDDNLPFLDTSAANTYYNASLAFYNPIFSAYQLTLSVFDQDYPRETLLARRLLDKISKENQRYVQQIFLGNEPPERDRDILFYLYYTCIFRPPLPMPNISSIISHFSTDSLPIPMSSLFRLKTLPHIIFIHLTIPIISFLLSVNMVEDEESRQSRLKHEEEVTVQRSETSSSPRVLSLPTIPSVYLAPFSINLTLSEKSWIISEMIHQSFDNILRYISLIHDQGIKPFPQHLLYVLHFIAQASHFIPTPPRADINPPALCSHPGIRSYFLNLIITDNNLATYALLSQHLYGSRLKWSGLISYLAAFYTGDGGRKLPLYNRRSRFAETNDDVMSALDRATARMIVCIFREALPWDDKPVELDFSPGTNSYRFRHRQACYSFSCPLDPPQSQEFWLRSHGKACDSLEAEDFAEVLFAQLLAQTRRNPFFTYKTSPYLNDYFRSIPYILNNWKFPMHSFSPLYRLCPTPIYPLLFIDGPSALEIRPSVPVDHQLFHHELQIHWRVLEYVVVQYYVGEVIYLKLDPGTDMEQVVPAIINLTHLPENNIMIKRTAIFDDQLLTRT